MKIIIKGGISKLKMGPNSFFKGVFAAGPDYAFGCAFL
jgi:hypothetical protein